MPSLLTIPREIRDQIYDWSLSDTLASFRSRELQRARRWIQYSPSDPETLLGEDTVEFPAHTSLPPAHGLLHTARQIRLEFMESIKRLGGVRYKVDLVDRKDRGVLAPTWISVPCLPCFVDRIDVLEVRWRVRERKTSSIFTSVGVSRHYLMEEFNGSLALLQRFVERGVYLLSKKKRRKVHIGVLEIHLDAGVEIGEEDLDEYAEDACLSLDLYLMGDMSHIYDGETRQIFDAQFEMLASKIDRIQMHANGRLKREWELADVVVRREEHIREVATRGEDSEDEL
jgi:hypothetical protein